MRFRSAAPLIAVLSSACATAPPPAPERQPTPIAASFAKTWDSVIDIFAQRNIPIKTLDRSSGLIVAEQARVTSFGDYANCGSALAAALASMGGSDPGPVRADYNVLVRGDSTRATVRVTARFGDSQKECPSKGVFETQFENAVKVGAESSSN